MVAENQSEEAVTALDVFHAGAVVRLEGAERDAMVIGYGGKGADGGAHDCIGVPHQFGLVSDDALMAFDAAQVAGVQFFGYGNAPAQEYAAKIARACESGELEPPMLSGGKEEQS